MKFSKIVPYLIAISIFVLASIIYFYPVLKGQKLQQSDITQFRGMVKEINDYRAENNAEPYWTGASFSGMPAYQISAYYPNDFVRSLDQLLRFLPRPADYTFLYFFSFFILMMALKIPWRIAILGSVAFGFSTYLIIIFGAGHNAKAHAIAYMPLVTAGVLWIFERKYILGFTVTALAMALEIYTNHPQMTYYLGFCLLILGIVKFVDALKKEQFSIFAKQAVIIIASVLLGVGANAPRLMAMKEYADKSTRGKSELTIAIDGSQKEATKGLDKAYITEYSYAKLETFNLFIPRFMGGGTLEELDNTSNFHRFISAKAGRKVADDYSKQVLTYWGDQTYIEAPAYIGAVVFFLFFIALFLVKGPLKQWLLAATVFSIILSWGRNFEIVTNFFIDYVPLYNKFRAVSSIQVIAEFCVPILAALGLKEFFSSKITKEIKQVALKKAVLTFVGFIVAGFCLAHLFGTFSGLRDSQQYTEIPGFLDAVIADRKDMLFSDAVRSILFTFSVAAVLWLMLQNKLKEIFVALALFVFIIFDLVSVNKEYVNKDDFKKARNIEQPFVASEADKQIVQDTTHYRVANFTTDIMNDGSTSYFHQSIGGYHAAKIGRYQELFEYQIAKNNMQVLNMLNTKYFIVPDDKGNPQAQLNINANGNAWFVNNFVVAKNANEEILALDSLNTKKAAVISMSDAEKINITTQVNTDSIATISLQEYKVTSLVYHAKTAQKQFAVFSEIFYEDGWNAYLNDKLVPHYNVNYVLRGMEVPAGNHTIVFKYEPKVIQQGKIISLSSYAIILLVAFGWFFYNKKKSFIKS